jgi:hypothetical protein
MSEKQVEFVGFPVQVSMFGSQVTVIDNNKNLYSFDAEKVPTGKL